MPSLGDLPDPGIEPASLMSPPLTDRFFTTMTTWVAQTQLLRVLTPQNVWDTLSCLIHFIAVV